MWARIHLTPLLQAEEDRDQVRRYWADQAREKELLGENRQVYHTDRYVHIPIFPRMLGVPPPLSIHPFGSAFVFSDVVIMGYTDSIT
jgi:hypothetical protein